VGSPLWAGRDQTEEGGDPPQGEHDAAVALAEQGGDGPEPASEPAQPGVAPVPADGLRRDWRVIGLLIVAAWVLPVLAYLVRADALLIVLIVWGTGGLLRAGGTVLDRLMLTVALLIGTAITAGLVFSLWPFGLNPIAVGGTALTVLILLGTALRRRPRWPRRVLGTDLALLGVMAVGAFVAYGPSRRPGTDVKLALAGITGDRLRHFSLFDTIHRLGGYPFLMQNQARHVVDPAMLVVYPPGMHFTYALLDVFITSRTSTGSPVDEMIRYNIYASLGYGFLVLCTAWGARWVAGPAMAGWRRAFLVAGIAAFLSAGVMTTVYWNGWDSQVFGMALLVLLAAVCLRPPTRPREHILVVTALCIAISMSYELFDPFAAVFVLLSLVIYRRRLIPHWRLLAGAVVVAVPAAASYIFAEYMQNALQATQTLLVTSKTEAMTKESLAAVVVLAVAGFAVARARRRQIAVGALAGSVLCGLAVAAYWLYQKHAIAAGAGNSYYFEKIVQAWVVLTLIGVGTAGHLLRLPRSAPFRIPSRGVAGAVTGCVAIAAAVVLTGSVYYGKPQFNYAEMKPGPHTTWERVWMSGDHINPGTADVLGYLNQRQMLGDGVPTLVIWSAGGQDNVDVSLQLADLNHAAGLYPDQIGGLGSSTGLSSAGESGPWTAADDAALTALEKSIAAAPVPIRLVTANASLAGKLEQWRAAHPAVRLSVVLAPSLPGPSGL
jgi:hypothetical protein